MLTIFWFVFGAGLAALTVAAGMTLRARREAAFGSRIPVVDDDAIAQILERGEIYVDEDAPLDLDEIDDEEDRFWSETWDEPGAEW